jgi:hypothetical protein
VIYRRRKAAEQTVNSVPLPNELVAETELVNEFAIREASAVKLTSQKLQPIQSNAITNLPPV